MTTHDVPTTPIEVVPPDAADADGHAWSADLADAEFARLVKETNVVTPITRVLLALVVAAAGFIGGVLVERTQQPAAASTAATTGASRAGGANGQNGQSGGGNGGPGGATVGTITLIDGANVYVTTTGGDVVKVITNPQTTFSVSKNGTISDLDPSKTVVVQGTDNPDGTVTASQVSQGGFGAFGGGRRGSGGSGQTGSGGSARGGG